MALSERLQLKLALAQSQQVQPTQLSSIGVPFRGTLESSSTEQNNNNNHSNSTEGISSFSTGNQSTEKQVGALEESIIVDSTMELSNERGEQGGVEEEHDFEEDVVQDSEDERPSGHSLLQVPFDLAPSTSHSNSSKQLHPPTLPSNQRQSSSIQDSTASTSLKPRTKPKPKAKSRVEVVVEQNKKQTVSAGKKKKARKAISDSEEDGEEEGGRPLVPSSDEIDSLSHSRSNFKPATAKTVESIILSSSQPDPSSRPKSAKDPRRTKSVATKSKSRAISEDEFGELELMEKIAQVNKKTEDDDEPYGAPKKKAAKAKAKAKGKEKEKAPARMKGKREAKEDSGSVGASASIGASVSAKTPLSAEFVDDDEEDEEKIALAKKPSATRGSKGGKMIVSSSPPQFPEPAAAIENATAVDEEADDESSSDEIVPIKSHNTNKRKRIINSSDGSDSEGDIEREKKKASPQRPIVRKKASRNLREEAIMQAAMDTSTDHGLAVVDKAGGEKENGSDEDEDEDMLEKAVKENQAPKPAVPEAGPGNPHLNTPILSRARSATPSTLSANKRGLAAVISKKGLWGSHQQGLSVRSKIPHLHTNLKPPPPEKKALPPPKPKKRKKGDESYSDEERPFYETKEPEDWDSDEREEWGRVQRKRERGF